MWCRNFLKICNFDWMPQSHVRTLIYRTWPITVTSPNNEIVAYVNVYILFISLRLRKEGMMLHTNGHDKVQKLVRWKCSPFCLFIESRRIYFPSRVQNVWVTIAQMNSWIPLNKTPASDLGINALRELIVPCFLIYIHVIYILQLDQKLTRLW